MAVNTKTKELVALKILEKEKVKKQDLLHNLKKEIEFLMIIEHPNIVKLIEVLASKSKIYLVLEYIPNGELWEKIRDQGRLEEDEARRIFRQIIRALDYCKNKKIAHRDLKPENILLDANGNVKISDFGLSSLYKDHSNFTNYLHTTCGTVNYLAPEVVQNIGYDGHVADIWACGVILYFCLAGYLPFEEENVSRMLEKIVSANFAFPKNFSKGSRAILMPNPSKRIDIDKIKSHPWFLEKITPEELKQFESDFDRLQQEKSIPSISSKQFIDADESKIIEVASPSLREPKSFTEKKGSIDSAFNYAVPRKLNAFEVATFLCGSLMNRLFDNDIKNALAKSDTSPKGNKNRIKSGDSVVVSDPLLQFTSNKKFDEITETIAQAFNKTEAYTSGFDYTNNCRFETVYHVAKEVVKISCEVFEITTSIYLIVFSKEEGTPKSFDKIYSNIFTYIKDLVLINENHSQLSLIQPKKC